MPYTPFYTPESPYHFSKIIGKFLTYYVHRPVPPHDLDRVTQLNNERYVTRPDTLAMDIYGDEDLWWIIPVRNGLQDPVFDLTYGKTLVIPDPSFVKSII